MPTKNTGKALQFWFDGIERPVESVDYNQDHQEIESTDSSTAGDGTEVIIGRAKRVSKIDAFLHAADGTEIATGTLTLNTKYIVTLGTITETAGIYPVGKIFTSDGTGVASSSNKVKPTAGANLNGKNISCTVAAVSAPVTAIKYAEQYSEQDATDSTTPGDTTEFITGRAKRTCTLTMIQIKENADLLVANPVAQAVVLTLDTGVTISGNAIFKKKSFTTSSKGDIISQSYDLVFQGAVTNNIPGLLPAAVQKAVKYIDAVGASTNKQRTGNGVILQTSIDANIKGDIKVSYTMNWAGTVTEAVAI